MLNIVSEKWLGNVLCDNGSELNFVTEAMVNRLELERRHSNCVISGIGQRNYKTKGIVKLTMFSLHNNRQIEIDAMIIPRITNRLPEHSFDRSPYAHLNNLQLADPNFNRPKHIDILIGSNVWAEIIQNGIRRGRESEPVAICTLFGWIVFGRIAPTMSHQQVFCINEVKMDDELNKMLTKFWELESFPQQIFRTKEQQFCEDHFVSTVQRNQNGRYVVEMPIKSDAPALGSSREIAIKWLLRIEKSLANKPNERRLYNEFMEKYIKLGHMRRVNQMDSGAVVYYTPHHYVTKSNGDETKFRVVFNASCNTTNGVSLNDIQATGEKLQDDLTIIILRCRLHDVVLTADIAKMYRQVLIAEKHLDYQRIVWRDHPTKPIQDFQLLTVTYGQRASPHLAIRALKQNAHDHKDQFPLAAELTNCAFYVDDFITSIEGESKAIQIYHEMNKLMKMGGFELCKWKSNNSNVNSIIGGAHAIENKQLAVCDDEYSSVLGTKWCPARDSLLFSFNPSPIKGPITKRTIARHVAQLYDPTGLIMPCIINGKLMIQKLWKLKLNWDEPVPESLRSEWLGQQHDLHQKFLGGHNIHRKAQWNCMDFVMHLQLRMVRLFTLESSNQMVKSS